MNEPGLVTITMSMHELDRLKVVQVVCERRLNIEVVEYRDGTIEIQAAGRVLSYREYDRITQIDRGAEVDNKRLSAALAVSQLVQEQRDDRRISGSPSRTLIGNDVRAKKALAGLKKQRAPPPAARQKATSAQANPTLPLQC